MLHFLVSFSRDAAYTFSFIFVFIIFFLFRSVELDENVHNTQKLYLLTEVNFSITVLI